MKTTTIVEAVVYRCDGCESLIEDYELESSFFQSGFIGLMANEKPYWQTQNMHFCSRKCMENYLKKQNAVLYLSDNHQDTCQNEGKGCLTCEYRNNETLLCQKFIDQAEKEWHDMIQCYHTKIEKGEKQ
jgi:hypothetical protein